jgi:hypothetical protein
MKLESGLEPQTQRDRELDVKIEVKQKTPADWLGFFVCVEKLMLPKV